jgi:phosphoribosylformylglycinamidine synthase
MDFKSPGNLLYQIGATKNELGGSHYGLVIGVCNGVVPQVEAKKAKRTFVAVHEAINQGIIRACHDLSEGGLAVAVAEMAFAGGWGAKLHLADVPRDDFVAARASHLDTALLFSESASRFIAEVPPAQRAAFESILGSANVSFGRIGEVTEGGRLRVSAAANEASAGESSWLVDLPLAELKEAWQEPLRW